MITETFDNRSKAIIDPPVNENALSVDACIFTFSHKIEKAVVENYDCRQIGILHFAHETFPFTALNTRERPSLSTKLL